MRVPTTTAAECEAQLPRGSTITSANRQWVQKWLTAGGMSAGEAKSLTLAQLQDAYKMLDGVRSGPPVPKDDTQRYAPRDCSACGTQRNADEARTGPYCADCADRYRAANIVAPPATKKEPAHMALQQPPTLAHKPDATDAAKKLAEAMQAIAALSGNNAAPLDEPRVLELIAKHAPKADAVIHTVHITKAGETKPIEGATHRQMALILKAIQCGNVYLRGPAGAGKTTVAEQCAKALDVPFYFTGAIASEYKLTGFMDAQGRLVSTAFRKAYQDGGLFLFDEIDASLPGAVLAFNAALANGHADFPDGAVSRHASFYCIAAANTFGQGADRVYVGRNQLDGATLDRFIFIDFDYDEDLERRLSGNPDWCRRVQSLRKAAATLKLRHVISPRASIMGAKLLAAGLPQSDVETLTVFKGLDAETVSKLTSNAR